MLCIGFDADPDWVRKSDTDPTGSGFTTLLYIHISPPYLAHESSGPRDEDGPVVVELRHGGLARDVLQIPRHLLALSSFQTETVKKVTYFLVPSRDVTNKTLPFLQCGAILKV